MCKFKETTLGIKKLDFGVKRRAMAVFLTDGREVIVPISMFPEIKSLSKKQREDYMIMDDQYFSFDASSKKLLGQRYFKMLSNKPTERWAYL